MAKKRELEITIAPDGTVQVHVSGMPGKQCLKVKEILEEIVGPLQSQRLTAEYYEPEEQARIKLERS
ncbi:MAG: DUF2997 domain-containing protein [Candidatus Eremiobacterota bacterium]